MSNTTTTTPPTYTYICRDEAGEETCAPSCVGLAACDSCQCATVALNAGGPWGKVMDVIFCLLPIIFLIIVTIKPNPWPTSSSLPFSALIMFLVRTMYLGSDPLLTSSCVILGLHEALTPLSIMAGAITLFEVMESTYCLPYMMREIKALTAGHAAAETMLIFCFAYMIEGASGFGTPVALGAPMLVSTGHDPFRAVVLLLIFNTFATVWGAAGTPLWFGFGSLGLTSDEFLTISYKSAICMLLGSFMLLPWILTVLIPFSIVRKNLVFIYLSLTTCMGAVLGLSFVSYEFPSLMGGLVGCGLTAVLCNFKVGLKPFGPEEELIMGKNKDDIGSVSERSLVRQYQRAVSSMSGNTSSRRGKGDSSRTADSVNNKPEVAVDGNKSQQPQPDKYDDDPGDDSAADTDANMQVSSFSNKEYKDATASAVRISGSFDQTGIEVDTETGQQEPIVQENQLNNKQNGGGGEAADSIADPKDKKSLTHGDKHDAQKMVSFNFDNDDTNRELDDPNFAVGDSLADTIELHLGPRKTWREGFLQETLLRTFPIWGVVLLLILTRVEQIGIKRILTLREPYLEIVFGTYGDFRISVSVVFQLLHILSYPGMNWKFEFFYLPFMMPFVLISICTLLLYYKDLKTSPRQIVAIVAGRLASPAIALMGALILVQLMIKSGTAAPSYILGTVLADWFKQGFVVISPILGALGSFFSGSTTVSNLSFGSIQDIAAERIGIDPTDMLTLQAVGASAGNGICLNNIIAACAVVGLNVGEGTILVKTARFVFSLTTIATIIMLAFFIRFK